MAETVLMNMLRGDIGRLERCTGAPIAQCRPPTLAAIVTGVEGAMPRAKPFKYTYEKEIVLYAYFRKLDYFSTECVYAPNAYRSPFASHAPVTSRRGHARALLKDLEGVRPSSILGAPPRCHGNQSGADILRSGEAMGVRESVKMPTLGLWIDRVFWLR